MMGRYNQRVRYNTPQSKPSAGQDPQKPSSARPTQLNANTHEAMTVSDAKVILVWTDGTIEPRCRQQLYFRDQLLFNQGENSNRLILNRTVAAVLLPDGAPVKNPHLRHQVSRVGNSVMVGLSVGEAKTYLVASLLSGFLVLVATACSLGFYLHGLALEAARDFEECVEAFQANAHQAGLPFRDARGGSMMDCNARFAGRRKPGGGYSYYDFMQDRTFDIIGPNLTAEERKRIDREYIVFLDTQRQENVSAELAKRQDEQLRVDMERAHQHVGRPLILTPKIPSSDAAKAVSDRAKSKRCDDKPLTCGWSKLSAAVIGTFTSSSRTKR